MPVSEEEVEAARDELIDRGYDNQFHVYKRDLRAALEAAAKVRETKALNPDPLDRLRDAIIQNTKGEDLFWLGEILLNEASKVRETKALSGEEKSE